MISNIYAARRQFLKKEKFYAAILKSVLTALQTLIHLYKGISISSIKEILISFEIILNIKKLSS
jgi:hypothetical protein